jgi:hypothetical protein
MTKSTERQIADKEEVAVNRNKMAAVEDAHLNMDGEGVDDVAEMLSLDKKKKKKKPKKVLPQRR